MAMMKKTRSELNKLRELTQYLLRGRKCCFCHRLLTDYDGSLDGDGTSRPLAERITIHHRDGDHYNKALTNQRLAHQSCHKAFHARTHPRAGGKFTNKHP